MRGEKEAYYIGLTEADKAEKLTVQRARGELAASLPWHPLISRHNDYTAYFQQFEDPAELPRLLRWYQAERADARRRHGYLFEATSWLERALEQQAAPWPIAAHADWRLAVIEAGRPGGSSWPTSWSRSGTSKRNTARWACPLRGPNAMASARRLRRWIGPREKATTPSLFCVAPNWPASPATSTSDRPFSAPPLPLR
ncbi:hypothetical protein [Hymenobacter terrenus]|uniref:hypothetical protein n=1 Tax=Hymenobacter terrenus TaxID=1629124 RepID=UPI00061A0226|nr:hypothetical protein [Hymenobacter terrenus]